MQSLMEQTQELIKNPQDVETSPAFGILRTTIPNPHWSHCCQCPTACVYTCSSCCCSRLTTAMRMQQTPTLLSQERQTVATAFSKLADAENKLSSLEAKVSQLELRVSHERSTNLRLVSDLRSLRAANTKLTADLEKEQTRNSHQSAALVQSETAAAAMQRTIAGLQAAVADNGQRCEAVKNEALRWQRLWNEVCRCHRRKARESSTM